MDGGGDMWSRLVAGRRWLPVAAVALVWVLIAVMSYVEDSDGPGGDLRRITAFEHLAPKGDVIFFRSSDIGPPAGLADLVDDGRPYWLHVVCAGGGTLYVGWAFGTGSILMNFPCTGLTGYPFRIYGGESPTNGPIHLIAECQVASCTRWEIAVAVW